MLTMALGIGLLSVLCACGNVEDERNMTEAVDSESAEANMGYQSESDLSQGYQKEQEMAAVLEYETREIHVDKDGMDIYGVAHIPSGVEGKMPAVIISHELGATLDRVKGYGEALAEEGCVTVCFDFCGGWGSRSDGELLDMSVLTEKADLEAVLEEVKQWDFVDADSIYLMGNSQGGLVTALTASEHREEIRAVILIYPAFCIYDDVHEMFDSPEEIPETMNKFYRGKNVKDSDIDGSGLGLYIASVLMAKMNGELICSSKGKGLTVTLMILLS